MSRRDEASERWARLLHDARQAQSGEAWAWAWSARVRSGETEIWQSRGTKQSKRRSPCEMCNQSSPIQVEQMEAMRYSRGYCRGGESICTDLLGSRPDLLSADGMARADAFRSRRRTTATATATKTASRKLRLASPFPLFFPFVHPFRRSLARDRQVVHARYPSFILFSSIVSSLSSPSLSILFLPLTQAVPRRPVPLLASKLAAAAPANPPARPINMEIQLQQTYPPAAVSTPPPPPPPGPSLPPSTSTGPLVPHAHRSPQRGVGRSRAASE